MTNYPTPETQRHLRAMCGQMAVSQQLNDEVQRELYGHMEDKLLAFLNGEEPITEEDALILVREHFGDPVVVKGLLQAVHPVAAGSHFLRRVAAILCADTVFLFLSGLLITAVLPYVPNLSSDPVGAVFLYMALPPLLRLPALYLLWLMLRFWQGQVDRGRSVWFLDYPGWLMACLGGGVFSVGLAYGAGHVAVPAVMPPLRAEMANYPLLLAVVYAACSCLIWVWWCDRPPRLRSSILMACGFWAAFEFLLTVPPQAQLLWMLSRGSAPMPQVVDAMVHYFVNGTVIICAAGLCAMAVYTALGWNAARKAQIAGDNRA